MNTNNSPWHNYSKEKPSEKTLYLVIYTNEYGNVYEVCYFNGTNFMHEYYDDLECYNYKPVENVISYMEIPEI